MRKIVWIGVVSVLALLVTGCAALGLEFRRPERVARAGLFKQSVIRGEPTIYSVDMRDGRILDRDVLPADPTVGIVPHEGEHVAIYVNSVFVKLLKERANSAHVLVYAEINDDGTNDPATTLTKILYNVEDQPPGVLLALADQPLYGPTLFKGHPIRIRFHVIELDKKQRAVASKMITAVGGAASTASPEAAAAVGVAVNLAKVINAMNKDDEELFYDFTLSPVDKIGEQPNRESATTYEMPFSRADRSFSPVMSLRTGRYIIIKRELESRLGQANDPYPYGGEPSSLREDLAQYRYLYDIPKQDSPEYTLKRVAIQERSLSLEGGYLYTTIERILNSDGSETKSDSLRETMDARDEHIGHRELYAEKTYAVFTVLNKVPSGLIDENASANSQRDLQTLRSLLETPDEHQEAVLASIDGLSSSLKSYFVLRQISELAAKRASADPSFRSSAEYPLFWIRNLQSLEGKEDEAATDLVAVNRAVCAVLEDIVVNMPPLHADCAEQITALKALKRDDFETASGKYTQALSLIDSNELASSLTDLRNRVQSIAGPQEDAKKRRDDLVAAIDKVLGGDIVSGIRLENILGLFHSFSSASGTTSDDQLNQTVARIDKFKGVISKVEGMRGRFKLVEGKIAGIADAKCN